MSQQWQNSLFDTNVKNQHPDGVGGSNMDNVDLSSMIGDFIENEQYPYNLNFNDNLTELSPEETEQFLEDAFSLTSSKSPLSDDLNDASLSMQSSPSTQGNSEEMFYMPYLAHDVKQEELSPLQNSIDLRSPLEFPGAKTSLTPSLNSTVRLGQIENDVAVFQQLPKCNDTATCDLSSVSGDASVMNLSGPVRGSLNHIQENPTLMKFPETCVISNDSSKTNLHQEQPGQLFKLLQSSPDIDLVSAKQQQDQQANSRKRATKQKKQKIEPKVSRQAKLAKSKPEESSSGLPETNNEMAATSQTVSQVVMIPQVVFTSGTGDNPTSQPITAYITTTSNQVMTTLPIKIMSSNSSDVEKIPIKPIGKKSTTALSKKKNEKMGRKTSHNEVEKRYRESITTSLEDLKMLVFGNDTKSTKAGILRKAMDHIKYLRKINQRLKQENMRLKMAQKQTSLVDLVQNHPISHNMQQNSIEDFEGSVCSEDEEEELMEEEMDSERSMPSSGSVSPASVESVQGTGTFSMMNKKRFFLSMFMFAFMFLGPGKLLFGTKDGMSSDYITPHTGGRTILSLKSEAENDGFKGYTGVIVNTFLYLLFFAWLVIKGEPRYSQNSKNVASFRSYMSKADSDSNKNDAQSARSNMEHGLQVIGRPWSTSTIDVISTSIWHAICHILNQIGILSLIKALGWLILPRRLSLSEAKSRYHDSCAFASQAYARLLNLSVTDPSDPASKLICAKLSLAAINMAENADDSLASKDVARIYLNSAIMLRLKFGFLSRFLMHYLMKRAKSTLIRRADGVPDSLAWALHPAGFEYILSGKWSLRDAAYNDNPLKEPLEQVKDCFVLTQTEATLGQIMAPANNELSILESERYLSLLKQFSGDGDEKVSWWHGLLSSVFYIGVGMKEKATGIWESIDADVDEMTPYASDLYDLVDCYFDANDGTEGVELEARLALIEDSILNNFVFDEGRETQNGFFQLLAAACAEMALNVRIAQWESSISKKMTFDQLGRFERILSVLKEISDQHAGLLNKVNYFSEVLGVMAGTNPVGLTKNLLRSRNQQRISHISETKVNFKNEDFQKAKALLFILKHLPSMVVRCYPKSCITYLQNAGFALEKSGLKEMTEECKKILATLKAL